MSKEDYDKGYKDGLEAYAHWDSGRHLVGTCGVKQKDAIKKRRQTWNYGHRVPQPSRGKV